ncbi:putative MFS transporter [Aspergillus fijiensis CBS 313.89]|uniref:MFS general substrate transporter n=1 Tax=Aspergillus fijiensis CBS 313.89 TaxID=1448319 RepID=A0A8G1W4B1_9EURO|nr:MFS general substrate transporter [Aspergillus fijiensis CBS 313.89]RAK79984.1 MFS general substrate transporter [Aspergillus fijiensis CBS 313.89]
MAAQTSEKTDLALQVQKASNVHVEDIQSSELLNAKGGDYSGATAKTDEVEIRLVRKLDLRIMPILWMMYFLNYLDRNAIANARLNNLEENLHLVGTQYNTCISILFIGYLLMQIPSNMFMSSPKIRPSLFMSVCMASWAIVSALTALTKNYVSLVLVRFFLGVTEAPFYPGALFLLSLFYTRKEIALRISILYTGNIVATAVAGLIAAATFAALDQKHHLKGWQWLFIIEGVVTFFIAALGLLMLPDHPLTTRWLTPAERQLAHDRITRDTVAHAAPGPETSRTWTALRDALRDPRLYLLAFMQNMHLSACSFNNFFPTVVGSLGFDRTMTLVLTCPPYLVSGVCSVIIGMTSGRYNERTWHITGSMGLAVIGFVIACLTLNTAARYLACFLFASGAYAVNSVILGWVSATLGQTPQKKAASLSVVNVVANASYVYTAYLYPKSDGPRYLVAMSANAAFGVLTIASAWGLRGWLRRTNRAIREGRVPGGDERVLYAY